VFQEFPKMGRLTRDCVITEKIDGTNAQVHIVAALTPTVGIDDGMVLARNTDGSIMLAGSRTKYLRVGHDGVKGEDNFGFAAWVKANADALWSLGEGRHYGEWWGSGIQRGYGLLKGEKRFSLFNVARWADQNAGDGLRMLAEKQSWAPPCCHVVPVLYTGLFGESHAANMIAKITHEGSQAAPGFMDPEGIVIFHTAVGTMFKKTIKGDEEGKEQRARRLAHATA
jgi:hypothetical protein